MVFPFNSSSSLFSTHGSHKPLLVILTILHLFSTNHPSPSTNYSYPSRRFLPIYLTAISPFSSVAIHCSLENTLHRHRFLLFCVRVSATHTTSEYTPPPSTHHLCVLPLFLLLLPVCERSWFIPAASASILGKVAGFSCEHGVGDSIAWLFRPQIYL